MEISGVRVKLIQDSGDRLKAVCTVTFDECFVVRDVKVVDGTNGLFVAMPSRKMSSHCPACRQKNHLKASYCNNCGKSVPPPRAQSDSDGRSRLHKDLAHPITPEFREIVQKGVLAAFQTELEVVGETPKQDAPRESAAPNEHREHREPREPREPRRDKRSKPEREMEDIQPLELSEYDAIIADLKGGSPPAKRRDRFERRDEPKVPEPVSAEPPPERSTPEPAPEPEPEPKKAPRREREAPPQPQSQPVASAADSGSWPVFDDEPDEVNVTSPEPAPAHDPEPEPAPAFAETDDEDDAGGFGAGIL